MAENLVRTGSFIPGIQPGRSTERFIDRTLSRIVFVGAIYLAFVAISPEFLARIVKIRLTIFDGPIIVILVTTALAILREIESDLIRHHYRDFMRGGKIRGQRGLGREGIDQDES